MTAQRALVEVLCININVKNQTSILARIKMTANVGADGYCNTWIDDINMRPEGGYGTCNE